MAATETYINGAVAAGDKTVKLAAYTAPSGRAKPLLRVDDEIMLITDTTSSPTLGVVRGYMGTLAAAHNLYAGVTYGAPNDMQTSKGPTHASPSITLPRVQFNTQEMTATGATGTTAAPVTVPLPAYLNATGASGAGINLPVPVAGDKAMIRNAMTGVLKIYCVGGTINGTTGTTAVSVTATGNLTAWADCATAGAWYVLGNT